MQIDNKSKDILKTEYNDQFDEIRKKQMIMSFYKYGSLKENYETYNSINAIESLKIRLQKYIETGNTEFLADVANFAMIEFMFPSIKNAQYKPTDSGECEIAGFGVNQIKEWKTKCR